MVTTKTFELTVSEHVTRKRVPVRWSPQNEGSAATPTAQLLRERKDP